MKYTNTDIQHIFGLFYFETQNLRCGIQNIKTTNIFVWKKKNIFSVSQEKTLIYIL